MAGPNAAQAAGEKKLGETVVALGAASESLRKSEERFRILVESIRDYAIFMLDPDGIITSWNLGAERIKGYSAEEVIGKHFSIFYMPDAVEKGWPEYELKEAKRAGHFEDEGWRLRKNGSLVWANVIITALYGETGEFIGYAKVVRDLSERRRHEEALRQSEERFRLMVEAVQDYAIFMLDPGGHVISWNAGAQRTKGYTAEEIIGKHFSIFYPPEKVEERWPDHELKEALRVGRFEDEGWRVRKDGSRFWANVVITAVHNEAGELIGFTKVTRDLTERYVASETLKKSEEALEQANQVLTERNQELQDFAYVASHDLQEPLRKITTFGEMLEAEYAEAVGEGGRAYLERMRSAAARMSTLINDLLSYSRIATKAQPFRATDLSRIVEEVTSDLQVRVEETGGRIEAGDLCTVEADATQMRQLFQNLIGNALKFHKPDEPPVIHIACEAPVTSRGREVCRIEVADNGIGFEEKYLDRIFAPFQRLHTRAEFPGTGVGLAICKRIVERHGGTITARSTPGEGATFVVELPMRQA